MENRKQRICTRCKKVIGCANKIVSIDCKKCNTLHTCDFKTKKEQKQIETFCISCIDDLAHYPTTSSFTLKLNKR